jgi:DNA polymerase III sliding clamp (beta) subunit (PCNA family)
MKITFKTSSLFAALECAAKKDIRYYLQGINIQITKPFTGMVYGTDGHILFAGQLPYDGAVDVPLNLIIPTDAVKRLDKKLEFTELEFDGQNYLLGGARFIPVDGRYPDIGRVIPSIDHNTEQSPGTFDPALLVRARAALAMYLGANVKDVFGLIQRGSDSAVMHAGTNECLVVIMPMRATNETPYAGFNRDFM